MPAGPAARIVYQAYFRTQRGGTGLAYDTCRYELLAALGTRALLDREWPGRHRCTLEWLGAEDDLTRLGPRLGYTQAIVRMRIEPASGLPSDYEMRARWPVGRMREGTCDHHLEEVWVADEEERLASSPHRREFRFGGDAEATVGGPRRGRRLSPLDARALANMTGLPDGSRVLDPFAGLGTIPLACEARGLRTTALDCEPALLTGLRELPLTAALLGDATSLPFDDGSFDGIASEPPYHRYDRQAVEGSLPELARVTRWGGVLVLLIADYLRGACAPPAGCREEAALPVQRHRLACTALVWRKVG